MADPAAVYVELRAMMLAVADGLVVARDAPGDLEVRTAELDPSTGKPGWFGTVTIRKSYVAYHLIPLYDAPALTEGLSDALIKRRQGKTCFNVKKADEAVFAQLRQLTVLAARMEPDLRAAIGA